MSPSLHSGCKLASSIQPSEEATLQCESITLCKFLETMASKVVSTMIKVLNRSKVISSQTWSIHPKRWFCINNKGGQRFAYAPCKGLAGHVICVGKEASLGSSRIWFCVDVHNPLARPEMWVSKTWYPRLVIPARNGWVDNEDIEIAMSWWLLKKNFFGVVQSQRNMWHKKIRDNFTWRYLIRFFGRNKVRVQWKCHVPICALEKKSLMNP